MRYAKATSYFLGALHFQLRYTCFSMVVWLLILVLTLVWILLGDLLLAFAFFFLASTFSFICLSRYEQALNARIANKSNGVCWDVSVNGIKVGSIPDWAYAHIRKRAFFDVKTWFWECANLGYIFKTTLLEILIGIPAMAFWVVVILLIVYPEKTTSLKSIYLHMHEYAWNFMHMKLIFTYVMGAFIVRVSWMALFENRSSLLRYLELNINARVKGFIKFAGDGTVAVYKFHQGKYITP